MQFFASLSDDAKYQLTVIQHIRAKDMTKHELWFPEGSKLLPRDAVYSELFLDLQKLYPDTAFISYDRLPRAEWKEVSLGEPQDSGTQGKMQCLTFDMHLGTSPAEESTTSLPVAIIHPAREDGRLYLPTLVRSVPRGKQIKWNHAIYTINTSPCAGEATSIVNLNTSFRWDKIHIHASPFAFPKFECIRRILTAGMENNHDCFLPTLSTDMTYGSGIYIGGDGCIFEDRTNLKIVRFQPFGFRTFPIINGSLLSMKDSSQGQSVCSPYHFGGSRCIFEEETDSDGLGRIRMTDDVGEPTESVYTLYPCKVKMYRGKSFIEYSPTSA